MLAIVVSIIFDSTFLISPVNSLLAGDVKSKTVCFLCEVESCCFLAIIVSTPDIFTPPRDGGRDIDAVTGTAPLRRSVTQRAREGGGGGGVAIQ
jgi:hypothetical protein